ncbi:MAG: molybdenum cofactor synthesis domain-containing protein [Lachnospiraceae bacterium]
MGSIKAICISKAKGTAKTSVAEAVLLPEFGIKGDAHAGKWHRQVSLLEEEKVREFNEKGANVTEGAFGENLIIEGISLADCPVGTQFQIAEAVLELTQKGKTCHTGCEIYHRMGDCIMPREGVFTRVIKGGTIRPGDRITCTPPKQMEITGFRVAVITSSDSGFAGEREDVSGPVIKSIVEQYGYTVVHQTILPDEMTAITDEMKYICDKNTADLILTTGGTGFSPRDCMPEATNKVIERSVPGIPEAMRAYSLQMTKRAMLSRAACGIRKSTLILNLPGSPKAVEECLTYVISELEHGLRILTEQEKNCARPFGSVSE